MEEIKIVSRWDKDKILVCGQYKSIKECLETNCSADLGGANLRFADLRNVNLSNAKNYTGSHDFAIEIIRRKREDYFTEEEWSDIGKVVVHRICWDKIKEFKTYKSVLKKLADLGWTEYGKI